MKTTDSHEAGYLTLPEMFMMQSALQKVMFDKTTPNDSVEDFKYSVLALIGELGEVLDVDKRWKNIRGNVYMREAKLDELVDCMAFMVNMILYSGFSSLEFSKAFSEKNAKNFKRWHDEQEKKPLQNQPSMV